MLRWLPVCLRWGLAAHISSTPLTRFATSTAFEIWNLAKALILTLHDEPWMLRTIAFTTHLQPRMLVCATNLQLGSDGCLSAWGEACQFAFHQCLSADLLLCGRAKSPRDANSCKSTCFNYRRELPNVAHQMGFVRQYRNTTMRGNTNHYTRDYTRTIRGGVKTQMLINHPLTSQPSMIRTVVFTMNLRQGMLRTVIVTMKL